MTDWLPPYWVDTQKHRPIGGNTDWNDVVRETAFGRKFAKYRSGMTPAERRVIEMSIASEDLDQPNRNWGLIIQRGVTRFYYVVYDEFVGASLGKETNLVKVDRGSSGPVHGRPITRSELESELRKHNPDEFKYFQERWPQ